MKKQYLTIGAVVTGVLAVLGVGAQTVYAVAYTTTQVSQHNTASDCWEIIDGKVYNLTAFISAHPGGQAAITAQCGKDASAAFHNGPHGASAINAIASYQVGNHETTPVASTPTPTPASTTPTVSANTNGSTSVSTASFKGDRHENDDRDELEDEDNDEEEWEHHGGHEAEFEIELHSSTHLFDDHGRGGRDHGEDD